MANRLFEVLKDYSFMHSGYMMTNAVNMAILKEVPNVVEYLKNRCVIS